MDELISNLLMYGKSAEHSVLSTLAELEGARKRGMPLTVEERKRAYRAVRELLELATEYGFNENLWQKGRGRRRQCESLCGAGFSYFSRPLPL